VESDSFFTEYRGHATELVSEQLSQNYTDLMIVGGDGTLNEAINGLKNRDIPISIISMGTGNDFSKAIKLPKSLKKQILTAIHGKNTLIDVGSCNERLFINTMGFGFDGKVVEEMERKGKQFGGHLAYLYTVLRIVTTFPEPTVKFSVDGKTYKQPVFLMAINNGTTFGGGFQITPDAKLDDGLFDICLIGKISPMRRLMNFPKMQLGVHKGMEEIQMLRGKDILVESQPEITAHLDGEMVGQPPFKVKILPKYLLVKTLD